MTKITLSTQNIKKQAAEKTAKKRKANKDATAVKALASMPAINDLLPTLAIEEIDPHALKKSKKRVRKTSSDQLKRVIRSIQESGFSVPVLIDNDNHVIDGHIAVEAAHSLSLPHIPCIRMHHLNEAQSRLFAIAHNRICESGDWDIDLLRVELIDLEALELDLAATAFDNVTLDIIKADPAGPAAGDDCEDDDVSDAAFITTTLGDLYELGKHRILCGDALAAESYAQVLDGGRAVAVFTDPPYNCKIEGFVSGLGKIKHKDFAMAVGEQSDEDFQAFLANMLINCRESVGPGSVIFACMDRRQTSVMKAASKDAGLKQIDRVIWDKGVGGMGGLYRQGYEEIHVFCNGGAPAINNVALGKHGRDRTNVQHYPGANQKGSSANKALVDHPTPKPVEMIACPPSAPMAQI